MKRFLLYLGRWQLSSLVLAPVLAMMTQQSVTQPRVILATVVSNLVGGAIFFWVDKRIFKEKRYGDKEKTNG